jgi:hypothetical protein
MMLLEEKNCQHEHGPGCVLETSSSSNRAKVTDNGCSRRRNVVQKSVVFLAGASWMLIPYQLLDN